LELPDVPLDVLEVVDVLDVLVDEDPLSDEEEALFDSVLLESVLFDSVLVSLDGVAPAPAPAAARESLR
jgi:hypothetical protein